MPLKFGDQVLVSVRRHLFLRRKNEYIEKPNMETEGVFLDYSNKGKYGKVRITTVEGEKERSFPLACITRKK